VARNASQVVADSVLIASRHLTILQVNNHCSDVSTALTATEFMTL